MFSEKTNKSCNNNSVILSFKSVLKISVSKENWNIKGLNNDLKY